MNEEISNNVTFLHKEYIRYFEKYFNDKIIFYKLFNYSNYQIIS